MSDAHHEIGKYCCSRYSCNAVSDVDTPMGGMCTEHASPLLFQIQRPYELRRVACACPEFVPWGFMAPHERQALRNHGGQTLARLSERGGLSACEALAVVEDRPYRSIEFTAAAQRIAELLSAWNKAAATGGEAPK